MTPSNGGAARVGAAKLTIGVTIVGGRIGVAMPETNVPVAMSSPTPLFSMLGVDVLVRVDLLVPRAW